MLVSRMQSPWTFKALEEFGRTRLSTSFYMRDFLHSEIAAQYGLPNVPDDPDLALAVGRRLCAEVLEPLQARFGRLHVRSGFRSQLLNAFGHANDLDCGSNEDAAGAHIWDLPDRRGAHGAMACVVCPWLVDQCAQGLDWREFAWWIHDYLPYSTMVFYARNLAVNISWNERPKRLIYSRVNPDEGYVTTKADAQSLERCPQRYADLETRRQAQPPW